MIKIMTGYSYLEQDMDVFCTEVNASICIYLKTLLYLNFAIRFILTEQFNPGQSI